MHAGQAHESSPSAAASFAGDCGGGAAAGGAPGDAGGATGEEGAGAGAAPSLACIALICAIVPGDAGGASSMDGNYYCVLDDGCAGWYDPKKDAALL